MAAIKTFLVAHGEKIALGVVALLAFWSMYNDMFGAARVIDGQQVRTEDIEEDLKRIQSHAKSQRVQGEMEPIPRARNIVKNILGIYTRDTWRATGWDAPFYVRAPRPVEEYEAAIIIDVAPPEAYHCQVDRPVNIHAKVGGRRIALVWQEGPATRWRAAPRAAIWRKVVGDGKEDAEWEKVYERQRQRAGEAPRQEAPAGDGFGGGGFGGDGFGRDVPPPADEGGFGGGGFGGPERQVAEPRPASPADTEDTDLEEEDEALRWKVDPGLTEREEEASRDLRDLVDPNTVVPTAWQRVGIGLRPLAQAPNIDQLLSDGRPESAPVDDEYGAGEDGVAPRRWFWFVDKDVTENTVYRYRVVVYARSMALPGELRDIPDYATYQPLLHMGRRHMAISMANRAEALQAQLASLDAPYEMAAARQLSFLRCERQALEDHEKNPVVFYSAPPAMSLEAIGELVESGGFGAFGWSDYTLTPIRTSLEYHSDFGAETVSVRVIVRDDLGEKHRKNFTVERPALPEGTHEKPFDPADQAALRRMYPPSVKPTPIGDESKVGNIVYDFSSGWGLVDIRNCTVLVKRYQMVQKTDETGRPVRDENGEVMMEKKIISEREWPHKYLVIRELEPRPGQFPRFKPLVKQRRLMKTEQMGEEMVVTDWNPSASE